MIFSNLSGCLSRSVNVPIALIGPPMIGKSDADGNKSSGLGMSIGDDTGLGLRRGFRNGICKCGTDNPNPRKSLLPPLPPCNCVGFTCVGSAPGFNIRCGGELTGVVVTVVCCVAGNDNAAGRRNATPGFALLRLLWRALCTRGGTRRFPPYRVPCCRVRRFWRVCIGRTEVQSPSQNPTTAAIFSGPTLRLV